MGFYTTETCPEVADLPLKNRVGGSRRSSPLRAGRFTPQPLETVSETTVTVTITVSGLSFWLSRDPIGEAGFALVSEKEEGGMSLELEIVRGFLAFEGFDEEYDVADPVALRVALFGIASDPVATRHFLAFAQKYASYHGIELQRLATWQKGGIGLRETRETTEFYSFVGNTPLSEYDLLGLKGIEFPIPPGFGLDPPTDWENPEGFKGAVEKYVCDCKKTGQTDPDTCFTICDAIYGKSGAGWVGNCILHCTACELGTWKPFKKKLTPLPKPPEKK
jgi:hypothetical protein